ncbi:MAG: hypothetical protein IH957_12590 [Chloroflexi bacterium]|nr:hypothetical protein [Chloroflexota bacterium]
MNTVPKTVRLPPGLYRQLRQPMAENNTPTLSADDNSPCSPPSRGLTATIIGTCKEMFHVT